MVFVINRNLVFIDSLQFMNCSLDSLIKNLSDDAFKYLSQEFSAEWFKLVKQKEVYRYEYIPMKTICRPAFFSQKTFNKRD